MRRRIASLILALAPIPGLAAELTAGQRAAMDRAARDVLAKTGVASASVALIADGKLAHAAAYGNARLDPKVPATPAMRYAIGSVSKQFTAAAVLLLAEEGKLSLDDPVSRFLPELTRAGDVRVRQLLSHTSGYQDYWPQDYVPPFMKAPITARAILDRWAKRPLDFEPGAQYQYSNTGFVIAGVIVEKASGTPLLEFLQERIFTPLRMESVASIDREPGETDAAGYMRYALGPPRPAPPEGKGWLFAAGELSMTASDLARWNAAMLERRILSDASWDLMQHEVLRNDGVGVGYGLGVSVGMSAGRRTLSHGGEVSGFTAANVVFPDDRAAVTVLANGDASDATSMIADAIAEQLFESRDGVAEAETRARRIVQELQKGRLDRSLFTENGNSYFTAQGIADFASSLGPLGAPKRVEQKRQSLRGGMTFRLFELEIGGRTLEIWERDMRDGRIEQFQVMAKH